MSDNNTDDDLATDTEVAEQLSKHRKTLPRWDRDPKLKALGWPDPIYLNGRRHRSRAAVREFLRNAAAAHLNTTPFPNKT